MEYSIVYIVKFIQLEPVLFLMQKNTDISLNFLQIIHQTFL